MELQLVAPFDSVDIRVHYLAEQAHDPDLQQDCLIDQVNIQAWKVELQFAALFDLVGIQVHYLPEVYVHVDLEAVQVGLSRQGSDTQHLLQELMQEPDVSPQA